MLGYSNKRVIIGNLSNDLLSLKAEDILNNVSKKVSIECYVSSI